jgi:hypothetical protein
MRGQKLKKTAKGKGTIPMPPFYRTSITTPESFAKELNNRRGKESFSGQIVSDMLAYWEAVDTGKDTLRSKLQKGEASLIIEALSTREWKSSKLDDTSLSILVGAISDESLAKKFKVDLKPLIQKIESLTKIELLALLNWSRTSQQNGLSTEKAVIELFKE